MDDDLLASVSTTPLVLVDPFLLVCSSASAISARLCTHPLDTYRIRVQTWPGASVPRFKELIPKPRLKTLYAGMPVAIAFGVPALSLYLCTYEASKRYLARHLLPETRKPTMMEQLPLFMLSGSLAEIASGAIWTPMDVMKARMQKGSDGPISATQLLRKIWREEGYRGVWRGYWLSNLIYVPYISMYWTLYESLKTRFIPSYDAYKPAARTNSSSGLPLTFQYTLCSVTACALSAIITNPIELVQSRWQTSAGLKTGGIRSIVKELWNQGGVRAFGRGLGIRIVYAVPANGISMSVYESLKLWKGI